MMTVIIVAAVVAAPLRDRGHTPGTVISQAAQNEFSATLRRLENRSVSARWMQHPTSALKFVRAFLQSSLQPSAWQTVFAVVPKSLGPNIYRSPTSGVTRL